MDAADATRAAAEEIGARTALIVKLRATGPGAIDACAAELVRTKRTFASAARDGSGSLDRIFARHRLGSPEVVFSAGRPAGSLSGRRRALARQFGQAISHQPSVPQKVMASGVDLSPVYRVAVPPSQDLRQAAADLANDPHVAYVQLDHAHTLDQQPPSPPLFDDPFLSSFGSWGQPYLDLWGLFHVRAPEAWSRTIGLGVVAAVVDTGLDATHPDIAANVWVNPGEDLDHDDHATDADRNGVDDDANGFVDDLTGFDFANSLDANQDGDFNDPGDVSDADPSDDVGHGTHVAGTLGAVAGNGIGIAGVAPGVRVMALKGFGTSGSAPDSVLWRAVLYAAVNGATVINNSWSCGTPCPVNPLAEEVLEVVEALGAVVVTSAGNQATNVAFFSPENGGRVITVGAVGADRDLSASTNRGLLVDVVAPGGGPDTPASVPVAQRNILSLRARGTFENDQPFVVAERYARLSGTSMSSPHVAGAVALLRALHPELAPADVRQMVRLAASDLGPAGNDPEFGAGELDAAALVEEPRPDFRLELASPHVASIHDPEAGPVVIEGRAGGSDLAALDVSIARGLAGRQFEPLASFGSSKLDWSPSTTARAYRAHWDATTSRDGPHVVRVRASLRDGRIFDEHTIVGLERSAPLLLSDATQGPVARPGIRGRGLVWQVDASEDGVPRLDLVLGRFSDRRASADGSSVEAEHASETGRDRTRPQVLVLPGNQFDGAREGRELAWLEFDRSGRRVAMRCRLSAAQAGGGGCTPELVSTAPGIFGPLFLAEGWLVWSRRDGAQSFIEGCSVGRGVRGCLPRPLFDPTNPTQWTLQSFDGQSLLVVGSAALVRCRLVPMRAYCLPEPIQIASDDAPAEPRLDGDVLVFSRVDVERRRPPGCAPADARPSCVRVPVAIVEYRVCEIDAATKVCDPIAVSGRQVVEGTQGVAVSGRRVVWAMADDDEEPALHVCELDAEARRCPDQRLGGTLAAQSQPAIDGARIVWSDARDGATAIRGIELPDLAPARRSVRVASRGRRFAVPFEADPGSAASLRFELEANDGVSPQSAAARVFDPGRPGDLVWVIGSLPSSAPARSRWRLHAITPGGLESTATVELVSGRARLD